MGARTLPSGAPVGGGEGQTGGISGHRSVLRVVQGPWSFRDVLPVRQGEFRAGSSRCRSSAPQAHRPPPEWACGADDLRLCKPGRTSRSTRPNTKRQLPRPRSPRPGGPVFGLNNTDRQCLCRASSPTMLNCEGPHFGSWNASNRGWLRIARRGCVGLAWRGPRRDCGPRFHDGLVHGSGGHLEKRPPHPQRLFECTGEGPRSPCRPRAPFIRASIRGCH
jgi:hypothetical protein